MASTLHRFTPPTCTLEIKGKKSPLSRWTNQDILKNFQFQLSFDDPRIPTSKQVKVKGDCQDLERLQIAVNSYIQEFLYASFKSTSESNINSQPNHKSDYNQPYLQSQGLVNHELFFGNLTHDSTSYKIQLSTVQLFDLVTALEAYNTQIAALPELKQAQSQKVIPLWGGIAAATVAAVGITTIAIRSQAPHNVASSPKSESLGDIPQLNEVIPPQIPERAKKPTPKPKITEPLSSTKRLPPPPAVDTPKPKPDIPDPADYPLSEVARQSGLNNPAKKKNAANQQTKSIIAIPAETKEEQDEIAKDTTLSDLGKSDTTPQLQTEINPQVDPEIASNDNSQQTLEDRSTSGRSKPEELAQSHQNLPTAANYFRSQSAQLKEVKAYFKDRWQPPAELKQSLEYRLYLNPDGSIKRVVPLGKASKLYLTKTTIPVRGEAFISPISESEKSTIRLLLSPDGRVQAFTE